MGCRVAGCGVHDAAMREIGSSALLIIDTSFMPFTLEPELYHVEKKFSPSNLFRT